MEQAWLIWPSCSEENAYTFGAEGAVLRQQENVHVIIKGPGVEMESLTGKAG